MKITLSRTLTSCLLLGSVFVFASLLSQSAAEEPAPEQRPPMVELDVRFVRATAEQMAAAIGKKLNGENRIILESAEFEAAIRSLKDAKADFFSHSRVVTKSGRKASVESVRELPYPKEYEASKDDPTKFIPTRFETRNVGVVLEFGPTVTRQDPSVMNLDFVISVVDFLGFTDASSPASQPKPGEEARTVTYDELREQAKAAIPEGAKWDAIMPTSKLTTASALRSGNAWLIETFAPTAEFPRRGSFAFYLFITPRVVAPK